MPRRPSLPLWTLVALVCLPSLAPRAWARNDLLRQAQQTLNTRWLPKAQERKMRALIRRFGRATRPGSRVVKPWGSFSYSIHGKSWRGADVILELSPNAVGLVQDSSAQRRGALKVERLGVVRRGKRGNGKVVGLMRAECYSPNQGQGHDATTVTSLNRTRRQPRYHGVALSREIHLPENGGAFLELHRAQATGGLRAFNRALVGQILDDPRTATGFDPGYLPKPFHR